MVVGGVVVALGFLAAPAAIAVTSGNEPTAPKRFVVPAQWKTPVGDEATGASGPAAALAFEAANEESRHIGTNISTLVSVEPEFAYCYLDGETWVVGFSGEVPESVRDGLSGENVIFAENLGYNSADLDKLVEKTLKAVHEGLPESVTVGGGLDYQKKTFSINVGLVDGSEDTSAIEPTLSRLELFGYVPTVMIATTPNGGIDFQSFGQLDGTSR